jgi:hypothetical protein
LLRKPKFAQGFFKVILHFLPQVFVMEQFNWSLPIFDPVARYWINSGYDLLARDDIDYAI